MTDFATRRVMMVDTQVRPSDVTKFPIIEAMLTIPREAFVPEARREAAYMGENLAIAPGRVVLLGAAELDARAREFMQAAARPPQVYNVTARANDLYDLAFEAFVEDEAVRAFIQANNRFGYDELLQKFDEARERGYWTPRSNRAGEILNGSPQGGGRRQVR